MRSFVKVSWMVVLAVAVLAPLSAQAAYLDSGHALVPGLSDGDTFHLAFVSSDMHKAGSQDITTYNDVLQNLANNSSIGGMGDLSWKMLGSTTAVDARDNAPVSGPVYLTDGSKVADDAADFWDGSHAVVMNKNENGATFSEGWSWTFTGSNSDGTAASGTALGNQTHPTTVGYADQKAANWMFGHSPGHDNMARYYALSELITVGANPIPEPGTMGLLMLGLVGLLCRRGSHRS